MLNPIKINNFYSAKDCKRMKRKITDWENIFVNYTSYKELVSRLYKELSTQHWEDNPIRKRTKYVKQTFHQKGYSDEI